MLLVFKSDNGTSPFKIKFQLRQWDSKKKTYHDLDNVQLPNQDLYFSYDGKGEYQVGFIFQKKDPSEPWLKKDCSLEVVRVRKHQSELDENRTSWHHKFETEEDQMRKEMDRFEHGMMGHHRYGGRMMHGGRGFGGHPIGMNVVGAFAMGLGIGGHHIGRRGR